MPVTDTSSMDHECCHVAFLALPASGVLVYVLQNSRVAAAAAAIRRVMNSLTCNRTIACNMAGSLNGSNTCVEQWMLLQLDSCLLRWCGMHMCYCCRHQAHV